MPYVWSNASHMGISEGSKGGGVQERLNAELFLFREKKFNWEMQPTEHICLTWHVQYNWGEGN